MRCAGQTPGMAFYHVPDNLTPHTNINQNEDSQVNSSTLPAIIRMKPGSRMGKETVKMRREAIAPIVLGAVSGLVLALGSLAVAQTVPQSSGTQNAINGINSYPVQVSSSIRALRIR